MWSHVQRRGSREEEKKNLESRTVAVVVVARLVSCVFVCLIVSWVVLLSRSLLLLLCSFLCFCRLVFFSFLYDFILLL